MPTLKKIYQKFYGDLISKLQVKDAKFNATLYSADLFPGDTKAQVDAKSTPAEAAMHFLDSVIDRGWTDDNSNSQFEKLLTVMESYEDDVVNSLASDIRKGNNLVYTCMYACWHGSWRN